ncbi:TPA: glycosyltransferase [Escherichia albertii]
MKKIAIIFPFARENGACRVPCEHSQMFVKAGYHVDLIVRDPEFVFPFSGNLISLDIKSRKNLLKILTYIELLFKIRKLKRKNKYDVCISHIPHCDLINVLTKKNETTITTVHINNEKRYSYISNILLRYIVHKSDYVVAVSQKLKEKLSLKYPKSKNKIVCIYNPVNINTIQKMANVPIDRRLHFSDYIINVGRLDIQKGQHYLISGFDRLVKRYHQFNNLKLVIIGDGPLEASLRELIETLGIKDKVILLGFNDNPYKYLKRAKLFVLTSLYEGFPLVLLEAMACGTPVISTACETGPFELLHGDNDMLSSGILIPDFLTCAKDKNLSVDSLIDNLSETMARVLNSPELSKQLVINATLRIKEFTPKAIMFFWEELFGGNCEE